MYKPRGGLSHTQIAPMYRYNYENYYYDEIYGLRERPRREYLFAETSVLLSVREHRTGCFVISRPTVRPVSV